MRWDSQDPKYLQRSDLIAKSRNLLNEVRWDSEGPIEFFWWTGGYLQFSTSLTKKELDQLGSTMRALSKKMGDSGVGPVVLGGDLGHLSGWLEWNLGAILHQASAPGP